MAGHHEGFYCNAHVCVIRTSSFETAAYDVCGLRQEKGAEPPWCRAHACAGCDFLVDGTGTGKALGSCTLCACTMDGCRRRRVKKGRTQTEKWNGHVRCPTTDYERHDPQWHPEHKAGWQRKEMDWGREAATTCAAHSSARSKPTRGTPGQSGVSAPSSVSGGAGTGSAGAQRGPRGKGCRSASAWRRAGPASCGPARARRTAT